MSIPLKSAALAARAPSVSPGATVLVVMLAITVAFPWLAGPFGHIATDEQIYHLMVRAIDSAGSLHLWNGYEEYPAKELMLPFSRVHDGRLAAQYPYLFGIVAVPFYRMFGFAGLLLVNGLAYVATVALSVAMAQRMFGDRRLSIAAGLILVFATYGWQYSQAVWPHGLAMLMVVGGVYAATLAPERRRTSGALGMAFASGLIVGFGAGVRLDCVLAIPPIIAWFLINRAGRLSHAAALCAGTVPGLAALTYTNYVKFGALTPFSYGYAKPGANMAVGGYAAIIGGGVLLLLAAWGLWKHWPRWREKVNPVRAAAIIVPAGLIVLWLAWPWLAKFANGFYQLVVDLRIRDLGILEQGLSRGPGGSMSYQGGVQKSLLQSAPYLAALVIPLVFLVRGREEPRPLALPLLVSATYVAAFSYFAWHGNLVLNMRYFVSVLPFLSIAAAWVWREAARRAAIPRLSLWIIAAAALLAAVALVGSLRYGEIDRTHEFVMLSLPLLLAVSIGLLSLRWALFERSGAHRGILAKGLAGCLLAGFVWSGVAAFYYDYPRDYAVRRIRADLLTELSPRIRPDSLVLAYPRFNITGLVEMEKVRLGLLDPARIEAARPLIEHNLEQGRPVYLWLEPGGSSSEPAIGIADAAAAYAPLQLAPVHANKVGRLFRISRPER